VRCNDDRRSEPIERCEQTHEAIGHLCINVARRLIRHQELGAVDNRASDRDALLLAARQGRGPGARSIGKAYPGKHFADWTFDVPLARTRDAQRQCDVIEGGEMADEAEVLEHDSDPPPERREGIPWRFRELFTEEFDSPARGALREVQQFEE
jgi:hypothetical protein